MPSIYLDATDVTSILSDSDPINTQTDSVTAANSGDSVFGVVVPGVLDQVVLNNGVTGTTVNGLVGQVLLPGASSSYTYLQNNGQLEVYSGTTLVLTDALASGGTNITFSDGTVLVTAAAGSLSFGGVAISATTPTALSGEAINNAITYNGTVTAQYILPNHAVTATATSFIGSLSSFFFDGVGPTLVVGDNLTGTAGTTNSLTLVDGYDQGIDIIPVGVTLTNIQNVLLQTSGNAGAADSFLLGDVKDIFDTSPYSSVVNTSITSSGGGFDVVQASTNSTITVTHNSSAGGVITLGGSNITVTSLAGGDVDDGVAIGANGTNQLSSATGTITVNAEGSGAGAANVDILGGGTVIVNVSKNTATGEILIGNNEDANGIGSGSSTKADNPSGPITVTSNGQNFGTNFDEISGGTAVTVTVKGDSVIIGDWNATDPSNQPAGAVLVSDLVTHAFDNLTGPGTSHNNTPGGWIEVYGGVGNATTDAVNITTNTGGGVYVGNAGVSGTYAQGNVTVVDTSSDLNGAFGIGSYDYVDYALGTYIAGGQNVTVTQGGANVIIGSSLSTYIDTENPSSAADNPTGQVTVTETVASHQTISIDGGSGVTVNAMGQTVNIGTDTGTAGTQVVNQSSVYTGNGIGDFAGAVTVDGGGIVDVNTTGGDVTIGSLSVNNKSVQVPSGVVSITDSFSGADTANGDSFNVLGGAAVNITVQNTTSGEINVGILPVLSEGTTISNLAGDPLGNVTIKNFVTNGTTTTYGSATDTIYTNGATSVSITGAGSGNIIADVNSFANASNSPVNTTSYLTTVSLDGVAGTAGIDSNAITTLSIADSLMANTATDVTIGGPAAVAAGFSAIPAHALALTLNNDTNADTSVTDATATSVAVGTGAGATASNINLITADATVFTFTNSAAVNVVSATMSAKGTETIDASGATGALNLGDTTAYGAHDITSITGGKGGVTATIDGDVTAFTGGTGVNIITVSDPTGLAQTVTGGGNAASEVILNNVAVQYDGFVPGDTIAEVLTGFSILGLEGAVGTAPGTSGTYDVSNFTGVNVSGSAAALTLINAGPTETLTFTGAPTGLTTWELAADNTGHNALTVNIVGNANTGAGVAAGTLLTEASLAALTGSGINTVTINSLNAASATANSLTLTDNDNLAVGSGTTKIIITGNGALTLTDSDETATTVDASGSTGKVDVSNVLDNAAGMLIKGGAGQLVVNLDNFFGAQGSDTADTVTTGTGGAIITLGEGNSVGANTGTDVVNLGNSATVRSTLNVNTVTNNTGTGTYGTINGFHNFDPSGSATPNLAISDVVAFDVTPTAIIANATGLDGFGASNGKYAVSDGVFSVSTAPTTGHFTGTNTTAGAQELTDVQALIDGGGAGTFGAVHIGGATYVIYANGGGVDDSIIQLNGVNGITGFSQSSVDGVLTSSGNTITIGNSINGLFETNGGLGNGGTISGIAYDDTGFSVDSFDLAASLVVNTYNNLGNAGTLIIGDTAAVTEGNIVVNQLGTNAELVVTNGGFADATLTSLTYNTTGSNTTSLVLDASNNALTIGTLKDAAGVTPEIWLTDDMNGNTITVKAITDAALTTIDATHTAGAVNLGTDTASLTQNGLTVLGGTGSLTVFASGTADTITGQNGGDAITASGASSVITDGSGVNTITAGGNSDHITVGQLATGAAITNAQTIHAAGTGDTITFSTTATDGTATTWTDGASIVDGGISGLTHLGIGLGDTINIGGFSNEASVEIYLTGAVIPKGVTSSNLTAASFTTLNGVTTANIGNDILYFGNQTTEVTAGASFGASQVNIQFASGVTPTLAGALDLAASTAALSQQGNNTAAGVIAGHTGVLDWFQYGGNTYIEEVINGTSASATHTGLVAGDQVVKIAGLVDLSGMSFVAHQVLAL